MHTKAIFQDNSESGLLSIDFLAGFTIFIISLILVMTMVSGLFVGLQSKTVDYDSVAYRTGVILAEDPGQVTDTILGQGVVRITPDHYSWELTPVAYQDSNILRLGFALPRYYYDTPSNVWLSNKQSTFFSQFASGHWTSDFYRNKMIFGDYSYHANITIIKESGEITSIGDQAPDIGYYGSIRRIGLIKEPTYINSNLSDYMDAPAAGERIINYKLTELYFREPAYQVYPKIENTSINFTEIPIDDLKITAIKVCYPTCDPVQPGQADIIVNGIHHGIPTVGNPIALDRNGTNVLNVTPAMFDIPNLGATSEINVTIFFNNNTVGGIDYYDPNSSRNITNAYQTVMHVPNLTPAWMVVKIW